MSVHLAKRKIIKEWTDYNEHMNMAYYVLVFDEAWETILNKFKMGGSNAKTTKRSTMVVETRTTYNNEVKENDEVEVFCTHFDHDKKRLHLKCEMYEKKTKTLSAIKNGFDKAMSTILDANITTLIASLLLFVFGSGPIKGFSITLSLGIFASMFSAIMFTNFLVYLWYSFSKKKEINL